MIIGLTLRHYKCYNNLNYIPITNKNSNSLSLFVGNNGVGKSSILEALNTFFNNGYWNRTKGEKQDQTFICPIFSIKKSGYNKFFNCSHEDKGVLELISNFMFNIDENNKEFKEFVKTRNKLNISCDDYYLIIIGINYKDRNKAYFGSSFDNEIRSQITDLFPNYDIDKILHQIRRLHSFIYIPVESKTEEILRLEATEMQKLMNKNILETIEIVLKEKKFNNLPKKGLTDLVSIINSTLNNFMEDINDQIKLIDPDYSFKVEDGFKKNLTATDLREQILKAYFSIRTLKKDGKELYQLSSGEQRIALIDIATAFIKNNKDKKGIVIIAIDEPEASLHISNCFNQFKRVEQLSYQKNTQVLATTHWYGSIPTINNGTLNIIQNINKVDITSFSLNNYLEDRREFPDDIDLKSYFELVSTILSSIKSTQTNWLILEGSDDVLYYKKYLEGKIENLQFLPVGGCGNVIKIFEYLFAPFSEKTEKGILKNAKVLCLIDSDINRRTTRYYNHQIENSLRLCRIQDFQDECSLVKLNTEGNYFPTTIEDCLEPSLFYEALDKTIRQHCTSNIIEIFDLFEKNYDSKSSRINSEISLIIPKSIDGLKQKNILLESIRESDFKMKLAENYISLEQQSISATPPLFQLVLNYFNEK